MLVECPKCKFTHEISFAAILGKEGGKKSRRTITKEQQAKMLEARMKKKEKANE